MPSPASLEAAYSDVCIGKRGVLGRREDLGLAVDRTGRGEGDLRHARRAHRLEHRRRSRSCSAPDRGAGAPGRGGRRRWPADGTPSRSPRTRAAAAPRPARRPRTASRPGPRSSPATNSRRPVRKSSTIATSTPSRPQAIGQVGADEAGPAGDAGAVHRLQREAGGERVAAEHLHGLQRVLQQILAQQIELLEQVVGDRDDVAADLIGLDQVEDLARRGPDQLRARAPAP